MRFLEIFVNKHLLKSPQTQAMAVVSSMNILDLENVTEQSKQDWRRLILGELVISLSLVNFLVYWRLVTYFNALLSIAEMKYCLFCYTCSK